MNYINALNDTLMCMYINIRVRAANTLFTLNTYLFDLKSVHIHENDSERCIIGTRSVFTRYYFIRCLHRLHNYVNVSHLMSMCDIGGFKAIQVVKYGPGYSTKHIIMSNDQKNMTLDMFAKIIPHICVREQPQMFGFPILKFELVNDEGETKCLKTLLGVYNDKMQLYDHTLRNILIFNNVGYHKYTHLDTKILNGGMVSKKYVINDILLDTHINMIIY